MAEVFYSLDQLDWFRIRLVQLAQEPASRFSKRQVIESLFDELQAALEKHSYDYVAEHLREDGFEITTGSLKQYFTRTRRERQKKKPASRKSHKKITSNNGHIEALKPPLEIMPTPSEHEA